MSSVSRHVPAGHDSDVPGMQDGNEDYTTHTAVAARHTLYVLHCSPDDPCTDSISLGVGASSRLPTLDRFILGYLPWSALIRSPSFVPAAVLFPSYTCAFICTATATDCIRQQDI